MIGALVIALVISSMAAGIGSTPAARKLDDNPPPSEVKCSACDPQSSPPPPPKKHKETDCPPPPSQTELPPPPPPFYNIYAPPGNLYPVVQSSGGDRSLVMEAPILVGCGFLGLLALRWL